MRYIVYFALTSFLFLFFSISSSFAATCTPRSYTECELGNPTYCLSHGVKKGDIALVTLNANCTYSCVDKGPCSSSSSKSSSSNSSSSNSSSSNSSSSNSSSNSSSSSTGSSSSSVPAGDSSVNVVVQLPGIGGLNGGNANPLTPTRNVLLYLYTPTQDPTNINDTPIMVSGTVTLDTTTGDQKYGYFTNTIDVGPLNGLYQIFIKTNQDLRSQILPTANSSSGNTFQLTGGQTTPLPQVVMIPGDIYPSTPGSNGMYGDNALDISDYNMLINCYGLTSNTSSCPNWQVADLNDDGVIDGIDYNIMLRSFNYMQQNPNLIH